MTFARLKSVIRSQFISSMREAEEDKETRQWAGLLPIKLLYSLFFFGVVDLIYARWADKTLSVMMAQQPPLARTEQFTLSVLIHYPQYLLWGIMGGVVAVLALHCFLLLVTRLGTGLYHRMIRNESVVPLQKKEAVRHD